MENSTNNNDTNSLEIETPNVEGIKALLNLGQKNDVPKEIKFYLKDQPFGWLSNFYRAPIVIEGVTYQTSEHYYQSQKAIEPAYREWIRNAPTPHLAFKATRALKPEDLAPHWDDIKLLVMERACRAKFRQNRELATLLMRTGEVTLIEDSKVDSFWGCGPDGNGENNLGKILMRIRKSSIPFNVILEEENRTARED